MDTNQRILVNADVQVPEGSLLNDNIGSRTLTVEERERYRELFRRLTRDERHEEQEVTRLILQARAAVEEHLI